jgi:hypothetical protein
MGRVFLAGGRRRGCAFMAGGVMNIFSGVHGMSLDGWIFVGHGGEGFDWRIFGTEGANACGVRHVSEGFGC